MLFWNQMKTVVMFLAAVLLCTGGAIMVARADNPQTQPAATQPAGGTITGTVVSGYGKGMAGVPVTVSTPGNDRQVGNVVAEGTTGEGGVFTIEKVPAGTYVVVANGKAMQLGQGAATVTVEAGGTAQAGMITLR